MDKLNTYRQTIMVILRIYTKLEYANADIQNETVFDRDSDRFLVISVGWQNNIKRIHGCLIHVDIIDAKVWVQRDGTEYGFANELVEAGISKEDIVLGFYEPEVRQYTGFAVV